MTIFMDTNVILDWLLDREDMYTDEATSLFLAAEENRVTIYISAGSVCTVAYVLHRAGKRGQKQRDALESFLNLVQIAGTDKKHLRSRQSVDEHYGSGGWVSVPDGIG